MFKRNIILFAVAAGFLFATAVECFADAAADLRRAKVCTTKGYLKEAEVICKSVIANYPGRDALKAREQLAITYILAGRTQQAKENVEILTKELAGSEDLSAALYWIARTYRMKGYAEQAVNLYQQIISQDPNSRYAKKAQLDIPRTNVYALLNLGKYGEAEAAIDKILNDFSGYPELPETLYDIARQCKHKGRYEKAKMLYQYILEHYPGTSYGEMCPIQVPKMDIWAKIASGDFAGAQAATDRFITDFTNDPELPDALHGIALRYEVKEIGRYEDAQNLYQRIIQLYPTSESADKSKIDIDKCNIFSLMSSDDDSGVPAAVDKLMEDFKSKEYLVIVVCLDIAKRYYSMGLDCADANEAGSCLKKAAAIWEKALNQFTGYDSCTLGQACYLSADCYSRIGDYSKAAQYYERLVSDYPSDSRYCDALFKIGVTYEKMKQAGLIAEKQANVKIQAAYQQLVETNPDYYGVKNALIKLGWLNFNKGQWAEAIRYWEQYVNKYPGETNLANLPDELYALGRAYEETNQTAKAIQTYQRLLSILPNDDPRAIQVQTKLENLK